AIGGSAAPIRGAEPKLLRAACITAIRAPDPSGVSTNGSQGHDLGAVALRATQLVGATRNRGMAHGILTLASGLSSAREGPWSTSPSRAGPQRMNTNSFEQSRH